MDIWVVVAYDHYYPLGGLDDIKYWSYSKDCCEQYVQNNQLTYDVVKIENFTANMEC